MSLRLTENARVVLERRYLQKDQDRNVTETPEQLFRRVASAVSRVEERYGFQPSQLKKLEDEYYDLMTSLVFMPNSPTLMNAGRPLGQLSACFVLPVEDSLEGIFDSLKHAALIHQSGGGTGFSFSRLRPKDDIVSSTGGVASGPVSFMRVFNAATEAVKQGGTRRGANMGVLRVDHPDILDFITCKEKNEEITNFNISVALTSEFMAALERDGEYDLINPRTGKSVRRLRARDVFELIVEMAWKNGEPGVIFLDRINEANPTPHIGEIESTNPCGEQPLLPYEACNLGSLNLALMAKQDAKEVDWERLERATRLSVRFLDDVIDASRFPLPQIERMVLGNRKIGLGVMGFADLLIRLGIPYNSNEAVDLAGKIMAFIQKTSKDESAALAEVRGAFPNFPGSIYDKEGGRRYRNATTTTIAPTGTISIIAGCSSGIEPLFAVAFVRNVMDNDKLVEVNPYFEEIARQRGFYSKELMDRIAEIGSIQGFTEIPEDVRRVFVTAHDIAPEWHIRIQAAFQEHTDNAVSKTVNFRHEATRDEVRRVFELAYELGCKGVTVYRDGSRDSQVLSFGGKAKEQGDEDAQGQKGALAAAPAVIKPNGDWGHIRPLERPKRLAGVTDVRETPLGNLYLTLNLYNNKPFELFAQIGKAGSDVTAFTEAVARLISLAFRCGIDPHEVADQLLGIGASRSIGFGPYRVRSVPDAIGQFVEAFLKSQEKGYTLADQQDTALGMGQPELLAWNETHSSDGRSASADDANGALNAASARDEGGAGGAVAAAEDQGRPLQTAARNRTSFNLCPVCGMQTMIHMEGCAKCMACGHSEC